jgi:tRNA1Val (adenine37-N6)-methyltransferase
MKTFPFDVFRPAGDETLDSLFRGRLKILQPRRGYRFSLDSVLLAGLTVVRRRDRVVDLGTGCGVVPLLLAFRGAAAHLTGVEIQPSLAALARRNVGLNGLSRLVEILEADLRVIRRDQVSGPVSLVLSNPPYREITSGRLNRNREKALARHELLADLGAVVEAGARLLPEKGRLALIYPARRLPRLFKEVSEAGFTPKSLTLIHGSLDSPAKLAHLEAIRGGGEELRINKPFAVYGADGRYTPEMAAMYHSPSSEDCP